MKQMTLIEMDGFLKGKCIPSDLKVNETNAEYLVRKFAELESKLETALRECRSAGITIDNLEAKCAALAADNEKAMEAMRQADAGVKLAHEKFSALAAENAKLKEFISLECMVFGDNNNLLVAESFIPETPATDSFLAEVRAQGVEMLGKKHQSIVNALKGDSLFSDGEYRHAAIVSAAVYFAAELRKGGNQ
ncbi:TPA: ead/Ea22-like family protein [Salmonella enterica subsp. enterica serovar Newport]|nr:ead/Ea22-like family protein [Salmonella enterica subsp. enterica serovar Kottbus]HBZ6036348.1 ead/Ea22-like family protein [Salmonella enterica subsp. enterica serovar Newport]